MILVLKIFSSANFWKGQVEHLRLCITEEIVKSVAVNKSNYCLKQIVEQLNFRSFNLKTNI